MTMPQCAEVAQLARRHREAGSRPLEDELKWMEYCVREDDEGDNNRKRLRAHPAEQFPVSRCHDCYSVKRAVSPTLWAGTESCHPPGPAHTCLRGPPPYAP